MKCPYCGKEFLKNNLTVHVKIKHREKFKEFLCMKHRELLMLLDDWRSTYELSESLRLRGYRVRSEQLKKTLFYLARHGVVEVKRVKRFPNLLFRRCVGSRLFAKKHDVRRAVVEVLQEREEVTTGELYELVKRRTMRSFTPRYLFYILSELEGEGVIERRVVSFGRYGRTSVVRFLSGQNLRCGE